MSQSTSTHHTICFCPDDQHADVDRFALENSRAAADHQLGYYPTGHVVEIVTVESIRTVTAGPASRLRKDAA